jgi:thiol-disulfide isomerase/thioredoxin
MGAQSAPPNDNFADALPLIGNDVSTTGSNVEATKELGEPNHADSMGGKSVWWSWEATESGFLTVSTAGSVSTNGTELDTLLGIYIGSEVGALTEVVSNDDDLDSFSVTSKATLPVTAGTTYWIAVDGFSFDPDPADAGTIQLSLSFSPPPPPRPAPGWALPDISGQTVYSTNFAGKVILLNFWATWCGPCVEETPDLVNLHNQYASDGFTVIGISVDNAVNGAPPTALVDSFVINNQMSYPVVMSRPGLTVEFNYGGIPAIPATFIIDRQNNIVAQIVGNHTKSYYESLVKPVLYADLRLGAEVSANGLRLSWPVTQADFVLEAAESIGSSAWQAVSATVQVEQMNRVVNLKTDSPARFYRLRMQ